MRYDGCSNEDSTEQRKPCNLGSSLQQRLTKQTMTSILPMDNLKHFTFIALHFPLKKKYERVFNNNSNNKFIIIIMLGWQQFCIQV